MSGTCGPSGKASAEMGLDWDAPAYPETEPVTANAPAAPLKLIVDMGVSGGEVQSLLEQARQFEQAGRIGEAIDVLREASRRSPDVAVTRNNLAWLFATGPEPLRNPTEALEHARHAVRLAQGEAIYLNTLGVALYRAGHHSEAITTLEESLAAGHGQTDAFDLFFLAMAHQKLGHTDQARACFDRAVRWWAERKNLPAQYLSELTGFRAEAEGLLAVTRAELPANAFAPD